MGQEFEPELMKLREDSRDRYSHLYKSAYFPITKLALPVDQQEFLLKHDIETFDNFNLYSVMDLFKGGVFDRDSIHKLEEDLIFAGWPRLRRDSQGPWKWTEGVYEIPISKLCLQAKLEEILQGNGFTTLGRLLDKSSFELRQIESLSQEAIYKIESALAFFDLHLRP
jgi:hypothetical protein